MKQTPKSFVGYVDDRVAFAGAACAVAAGVVLCVRQRHDGRRHRGQGLRHRPVAHLRPRRGAFCCRCMQQQPSRRRMPRHCLLVCSACAGGISAGRCCSSWLDERLLTTSCWGCCAVAARAFVRAGDYCGVGQRQQQLRHDGLHEQGAAAAVDRNSQPLGYVPVARRSRAPSVECDNSSTRQAALAAVVGAGSDGGGCCKVGRGTGGRMMRRRTTPAAAAGCCCPLRFVGAVGEGRPGAPAPVDRHRSTSCCWLAASGSRSASVVRRGGSGRQLLHLVGTAG